MSTMTEHYQGAEITFGGDGWVNATQMAKPFRKKANDFLRIDATKAFVAALCADVGKSGNPDLVVATRHGGSAPGTWMHPDLALEFARWLSPEFAIWCNRTIRRIMSGEAQLGPAGGQLGAFVEQLGAVAEALKGVSQQVASWHGRIEKLERGQGFDAHSAADYRNQLIDREHELRAAREEIALLRRGEAPAWLPALKDHLERGGTMTTFARDRAISYPAVQRAAKKYGLRGVAS